MNAIVILAVLTLIVLILILVALIALAVRVRNYTSANRNGQQPGHSNGAPIGR